MAFLDAKPVWQKSQENLAAVSSTMAPKEAGLFSVGVALNSEGNFEKKCCESGWKATDKLVENTCRRRANWMILQLMLSLLSGWKGVTARSKKWAEAAQQIPKTLLLCLQSDAYIQL